MAHGLAYYNYKLRARARRRILLIRPPENKLGWVNDWLHYIFSSITIEREVGIQS